MQPKGKKIAAINFLAQWRARKEGIHSIGTKIILIYHYLHIIVDEYSKIAIQCQAKRAQCFKIWTLRQIIHLIISLVKS